MRAVQQGQDAEQHHEQDAEERHEALHVVPLLQAHRHGILGVSEKKFYGGNIRGVTAKLGAEQTFRERSKAETNFRN